MRLNFAMNWMDGRNKVPTCISTKKKQSLGALPFISECLTVAKRARKDVLRISCTSAKTLHRKVYTTNSTYPVWKTITLPFSKLASTQCSCGDWPKWGYRTRDSLDKYMLQWVSMRHKSDFYSPIVNKTLCRNHLKSPRG